MEKCLLDYFRDAAGCEQALAQRIVKVLAVNGIYTIDLLLKKKPEEIMAIKGIGPRAMVIISHVVTREEMERAKKKDIHNKYCNKVKAVTLKDWLRQAGVTYLEACNIERILKKNGIRTVDIFMETPDEQIANYPFIGKKRFERISQTKEIIRSTKK